MGLLDIFRGNKATPMPSDDSYLSEMNEEVSYFLLNGLEDSISNAIRKSFSLYDFQIDGHDNQGGYFGVEFDLQATAGRLKQLYMREPWAFICADRIARTLSGIPFKIRDVATQEPIEDHPGELIVNGGNPQQSGYDLNWGGYIDLIMGGNFFKVLDEVYERPHQVPIEYINLRLRNMQKPEQAMLARDRGLIEGVEISRSFALGFGAGSNVQTHFIPYENVVHFKLPNPFTMLFGMSPFTAASRPILLDRNKNEFELAFYHRGATHAGVIETTEDITKKRMERLMRTFEQTYTGKRNWWRNLFLPKGAKWVNSGLTMAEMEHLEGLRENRRTILAVLGVPPSQVGIVEDVNRATSEVQEKAFYQMTIQPLAKMIADGYNNSFAFKNVFGESVEVYPDFSGIEAIEGSWVKKGEDAKSVEDVAVINEQREIAGLEPLPANDPRGNMFASEMRSAARASIISSEGMSPTPGDSEDDDKLLFKIGKGEGENAQHSHSGEIDRESLSGKTTSTSNESNNHEHVLRGTIQEDGSILVTVEETDGHTHPDTTVRDPEMEQEKQSFFSKVKATATANQGRISASAARRFLNVLKEYQALHLSQAEVALRAGKEPSVALAVGKSARQEYYAMNALPILGDTMVRGFDLATDQTKAFTVHELKWLYEKHIPVNVKAMSVKDEQAVSFLKEKNEEGRRVTLAQRNINSFFGFDDNESESILNVIAQGLEKNQTTEQIAKDLSKNYEEQYGDQAFTITRTEVLTAVSAGLEWQQDELKKVFDKVNKQWFHVGDVGSNPQARSPHADFESLGEVPHDYVYENTATRGRLLFPRDPAGGAADVINCRCSMVSVIPSDATSNANEILGGV